MVVLAVKESPNLDGDSYTLIDGADSLASRLLQGYGKGSSIGA